MSQSLFSKIFPPPKYLVMNHAGLDISDDSIHCLEYGTTIHGHKIEKHFQIQLPQGLIEGGDIKNEKELEKILGNLDKEIDLKYVKVSLPEEKAYLFQTEVPNVGRKAIEQNIESKLEANVPLSTIDAVFYYDLWPGKEKVSTLRASVSVVARSYVENMIGLLRRCGMVPVAFEVVPKSIARAVIDDEDKNSQIIIHLMNYKTGIYIVSGGIVCFTSTVNWGRKSEEKKDVDSLAKEINRVYSYWISHGDGYPDIDSIIIVGADSGKYENLLQNVVSGANLKVSSAEVWKNSFDINTYLPPIKQEDSADFVVAAGLALSK